MDAAAANIEFVTVGFCNSQNSLNQNINIAHFDAYEHLTNADEGFRLTSKNPDS